MTNIDPQVLRSALGGLQPVCDYVTELGLNETSSRVGVGVDGRGRLHLREEPSNGRFMIMGQLWVTTTSQGGAPTQDMLAGGENFRFGPILDGVMDLAVCDNHVLGVCTAGAFLGGEVGVNARMPAFLFRLELDLIEDVSIATKTKLFGGRKERRFIALRSRFPSIGLHGETVGRIEGVGRWNDRIRSSKTTGGEAGRSIAMASARQQLLSAEGERRAALEEVLDGRWRIEGDKLVAELLVEDET